MKKNKEGKKKKKMYSLKRNRVRLELKVRKRDQMSPESRQHPLRVRPHPAKLPAVKGKSLSTFLLLKISNQTSLCRCVSRSPALSLVGSPVCQS